MATYSSKTEVFFVIDFYLNVNLSSQIVIFRDLTVGGGGNWLWGVRSISLLF